MLSKDKLKKKGTGTYEERKEQGHLVGDRTHEAYPVEQCNENARRAAGKRLANLRGDQRGEEKKRMHLIGGTEDDLHSAAQSKKLTHRWEMEATPPTKGVAMWRAEYAVLKQATIQPRERKKPKIMGRHGRCKRRHTKKWPRQKQETQTQPEAGDTRQAHRRHKTIEGRQETWSHGIGRNSA